MTEEWLSVPCIARKLKVSRDKVRRWVKCGELRGTNLVPQITIQGS